MKILVSGTIGAVAGGIVATAILTPLSMLAFWPTSNISGVFGLVVGPLLGGSIGGLIGALIAIRRPTLRSKK